MKEEGAEGWNKVGLVDRAWDQHHPGLTRPTLLGDTATSRLLTQSAAMCQERGNRFIRKEDENSNYLKRVVRILHDHV